MKKDMNGLKKNIILILVAVFSFWGLNNLGKIGGVFSKIFNVLFPFILGGVIAFIVNIPMKKIESFLKKKIKNKSGLVRTLSIVIALILFIGVILFIALLLIPELVENIKMLISNIPTLFENIKNFAINLLEKFPEVQEQIENMFSEKGNITSIVSSILNYFVNGTVGFVSSLVSGFVTIFTAIIFAIYMLSEKEYLIRSSKKIIYAMTNKKTADRILEIGNMANITFSKFLSGQCLEAMLLGCLMFIAFSLFRFPYALLISVLTAVTALIPIFGAIIAMIIGIVLIAITNPIQAIIFVIVFQVVQQIEGNFIYPRVVGKSVGLSPMWTLFAITVGGNLFGIVGMLVGLPVASVVYAIIKDIVNNNLKEKNIKIS